MLEIILLIAFVLLVLLGFVVALMSASILIAYATQSAYDLERDINDD
jgi:hypothetical protein